MKKKEKTLIHAEGKRKLPVRTHGRIFQGYVTKKFPTRVVIEFERTVYLKKYERFLKDKTRIHARITKEMNVSVGDYVEAQQCRPLSKIIHFMVTRVVRSKEETQ